MHCVHHDMHNAGLSALLNYGHIHAVSIHDQPLIVTVVSLCNHAVLITLDMEVVLETAAPNITQTTRTNNDLAVVEFKPVSSPSQEYEVTYYDVGNNTEAPDLVRLSNLGMVATFQVTCSGH